MSGVPAVPGDATSRYLTGAGGTRLHYRAWPVPESRAAVLVLHGLFEHSGRYEELAATLGRARIATFGLDHRGHGRSGGRRGHVRRFEQFIEDTDRFVDHVTASLPDDLPRFLLAHSMGGLIGIRYLQERAPVLDGAIITSPWLGFGDPVPRWQRVLLSALDRVLPFVPVPAGVDADDLSHDVERVADYRADPRIYSTLTPRLGLQVEAAFERAFQRRDRLRLPMLFLIAGDDRVVDGERSVELARSLAGPDVTTRVLEGYYHEVLQEVERAAVLTEIVDWIGMRLP